jgi:Na+-translocating ferredoxin:NAD+ oxidoreductase subunit G
VSEVVASPTEAPASRPAPAPAPPAVSATRLVVTLGAAGAVAGLLLVFAFGWTLPSIEANRARARHLAITEVLKGPERYDTLYVVNGALTRNLPDGADARKLEQVYLGYAKDGQRIGFAVVAAAAGFQDMIQLIFGFDPRTGQVLGIKVLESKETPGLGDKIEKDAAFVGQFAGARPPLQGVKRGKRSGPADVEMITGATISSRATVRIINGAVERWRPLMEAYEGAKG